MNNFTNFNQNATTNIANSTKASEQSDLVEIAWFFVYLSSGMFIVFVLIGLLVFTSVCYNKYLKKPW